ncbi:MAG: cytochrome c-type biogenesis protein, partial [Gammaproteobacteria bacterium]
MKIIISLITVILIYSVRAEVPAEFDDPQQQQRYQSMLAEIRCLVCQNQSLADSNADLAQDLRNEVHRMVAAGDSNQEIIDYLVTRYGDFVLYRPPLKTTTLLLWFG